MRSSTSAARSMTASTSTSSARRSWAAIRRERRRGRANVGAQAGAGARRGAAAVILPFVLPPFLIVTAVAIIYAKYQGLAIVHSIFSGVGPAVLAIIAIAAVKLARKTNERDLVAWTIAAILCAATAIYGAEIIWLVLIAGLFGAIWWGGGLPSVR